jgi:hypothetical protein
MLGERERKQEQVRRTPARRSLRVRAPAKYKLSSNTTHLALTVNYAGITALVQTDFCMSTRGLRLRHKGGSSLSRRTPVRRCVRSHSSCQPPHGTRSGIGNLVPGVLSRVCFWEGCSNMGALPALTSAAHMRRRPTFRDDAAASSSSPVPFPVLIQYHCFQGCNNYPRIYCNVKKTPKGTMQDTLEHFVAFIGPQFAYPIALANQKGGGVPDSSFDPERISPTC